jgi:hypothetical protein
MDAAEQKLSSLLPQPEPKQEYWAMMAWNWPDTVRMFTVRFSLATHQDALNVAFALKNPECDLIIILHSPGQQSMEDSTSEELEMVLAR